MCGVSLRKDSDPGGFSSACLRMASNRGDPKTGATGGRLDLLGHSMHNRAVKISGGCLAPECSSILTDFFRQRR